MRRKLLKTDHVLESKKRCCVFFDHVWFLVVERTQWEKPRAETRRKWHDSESSPYFCRVSMKSYKNTAHPNTLTDVARSSLLSNACCRCCLPASLVLAASAPQMLRCWLGQMSLPPLYCSKSSACLCCLRWVSGRPCLCSYFRYTSLPASSSSCPLLSNQHSAGLSWGPV